MIGNDKLFERTNKAVSILRSAATGEFSKDMGVASAELMTEITANITEAISPINGPLLPFIIASMRSVLRTLEDRFPEDAKLAGCFNTMCETASCFIDTRKLK